ncbi:glycerophosphodiester phosphodiesterase [Paenibacillus segetis]|uniref:Glycerophosphoryl diester phosphodiesterase n=1 Tax=Paenibacillus segetis TaxID=1325360 RepID=A0ABQ1Y8T4_9BACL|nr:glycerophosphodiester phosphodiesterase family protein [Paenibacillus segetis]GGH15700.1 glycerophosphoryl diester phosphodiesterase [Paenibacillus segetis]
MHNPCVAHRGFSSQAPENTMAAITLAMEQPYVNWVEVDVQLSKDGVPLLIHDYTLNRTTSGRGPVRDKTWAELKLLDAGSWKSKAYSGERLITLDEFLDAICGRLRANIEIKTHDNLYPGIEGKVISAIKRRHMENDVVVTSFSPTVLAKVREIGRDIRTGLIMEGKPSDLILRLQLLQCSFLSINYRYLTPDLVSKVTNRGITIMAWTLDNVKVIRRIAAMHKDILICTNKPDVWHKAMCNS